MREKLKLNAFRIILTQYYLRIPDCIEAPQRRSEPQPERTRKSDLVKSRFRRLLKEYVKEGGGGHVPAPAPAGKRWQAVPELTDNFDRFDSNKWQMSHPYWSGRSPSTYNNDDISFGGGILRLKMTVKDPNKRGNWVWAAAVTSRTKAFKKGMYSEVRIKVANLSVTSSFWMQGNYSEIDVIENYGRVKKDRWRYLDYTMESNTHYFRNGWENDINTPAHSGNPGNQRNADRFYVYGVWSSSIWRHALGGRVCPRWPIFAIQASIRRTTTTCEPIDLYLIRRTSQRRWGLPPMISTVNSGAEPCRLALFFLSSAVRYPRSNPRPTPCCDCCMRFEYDDGGRQE